MRKARDHKAEYARRKARGAARGLTPSQARGHAKAGEAPVKAARTPSLDRRLEAGLKALRSGANLKTASGLIGVSTERLSRYAKHHADAQFSRKAWTFDDQRLRDVLTFTRGEAKRIRVIGFDEASRAGEYWNEANKALTRPDLFPNLEMKWSDAYLIDAYGKRHYLETDPNDIYRIAHAYDDQRFEDIYNIIV